MIINDNSRLEDFIAKIKNLDLRPTHIFVTLNEKYYDQESIYMGIVLKDNKDNFIVSRPELLIIKPSVEMHEVRYFWDVLNKLYIASRCSEFYTVIIPDVEFELLHRNSMNVKNVLEKYFRGRKHMYFMEDMHDINHRYPIAENYKVMYGEWFIKLQEDIKISIGSVRTL